MPLQINLVGDADGIILLLAQKLGWTLPAPKGGKRAISLKAEKPAAEPRRLGESCVASYPIAGCCATVC